MAAAETRFYPVGFDVGTRVFGIGLDVQERQRKCTALDRSTPSRLPCGLPYNRPPKAGAASAGGSSQLGPGKSSVPARWNTLLSQGPIHDGDFLAFRPRKPSEDHSFYLLLFSAIFHHSVSIIFNRITCGLLFYQTEFEAENV